MPNTTTSEVTAAVNAYLADELLVRAYPYFVHVLWAQVQDLPRNKGETLRFRRYTNLSAATTALTQGVTPTSTQLAITNVDAAPLLYGAYVTTTDFLQMTVIEKLNLELAGLLGDQAGDTIDQLARSVITAGTTIQYASTATTRATVAAGMILNNAEVREAVRTLEGNNAKKITDMVSASDGFNTSPIGACYIGIISQNSKYDLEDDPAWVPVEEYSQATGILGPFEVGKVGNVRFVLAGSNAITFSSTVTVHGTVILGRDFYGISRISGETMEVITKPLGSAGADDPLNQRSTMGWKMSFVAVRLNENFAVRIEHAVSS